MQTNQDCHHYFHIKMVIVYNMNTTMIAHIIQPMNITTRATYVLSICLDF
jgi:phosphopantothenoylcysteine synthetase/decarboxylase